MSTLTVILTCKKNHAILINTKKEYWTSPVRKVTPNEMHVNRRTLLALFFIICVKLSLAKDDEAAKRTPRKLINVSTSVKYVVPTRTSFTTVPLTCYSTLDVTGPCRRRRSFQERPAILAFDTGEPLDIDQILPTPKRCVAVFF